MDRLFGLLAILFLAGMSFALRFSIANTFRHISRD
jgi:hypothetical protein